MSLRVSGVPLVADTAPAGGVAVSRPAHTPVSSQRPLSHDEAHSPCVGPVPHGALAGHRQKRPWSHCGLESQGSPHALLQGLAPALYANQFSG